MKKNLLSFLMVFFPLAAWADGNTLSFAPPPSDYSVVFLGNIFGIVDGVLHGSGSQIMGAMFGVFNAAVLALGGIIIMYTLLVSTMNTAHEGQMLGQKWSSMWIPVRSTVGLALLIPKASGYCLMQIFVMWIVVQGVGAADKVWEAALGYLNRGGVIVQVQIDPTKSIMQSANLPGSTKSGEAQISNAAQVILAGQVCMLGLQQTLENQRSVYQTQKSNNSGPCSGTPSADMQDFCTTAVPDFLSTVDVVGTQAKGQSIPKTANVTPPTNYAIPMPDFSNTPYSKLNGVCGTLAWAQFALAGKEAQVKQIKSITTSDINTAKMSRAIAIQQMYQDLSTVAQIMVNNDPQMAATAPQDTSKNYSDAAMSQFGVPLTSSGDICTDFTTPNCVLWGQATTDNSPLFNGTEFVGAITDYNGVMMPTLNLIAQSSKSNDANKNREFIQQATTQGWIMAGSYFFSIVNLNTQGQGNSDLTDSDTGLDETCIDTSKLTQPFLTQSSSSQSSCGNGSFPILKTWFNGDNSGPTAISTLINGGTGNVPSINRYQFQNTTRPVISTKASSTVWGYANNSTILQLPGQRGITPPQFGNMLNMKIDPQPYYLPDANFDCGRVKIVFFSFCLGETMGNLFYNTIFRTMYNFFLELFGSFINQVLYAFIMVPLQGMSYIFTQGITILNQPNVNPIVALANMGTYYINFAAQVWLMLINMSIVSSLIPIFGVFIFALISLAMPILLAWISVMTMIGFSTAYYVPMLPYMIFTFGAVAWLIAVIEAMVAAPIVALGVTHPEGHDAFGKGEQAIMILMNVFLRPALMIIGYIAAISLSYVGVWIINAGFDTAIGFIQGFDTASPGTNAQSSGWGVLNPMPGAQWENPADGNWQNPFTVTNTVTTPAGPIQGGYTSWAGVYAFFFSILIYTSIYLTLTQKAFTLIAILPDKVLRWIGGQPEGIGQEAAGWTDDTKRQVEGAGKSTQEGQAAMDKQLSGYAEKGIGAVKGKFGGSGGGKGGGKGSNSPSGE